MWKRKFFCVVGVATLALIATEASAGQRFGSRLNREGTPAEVCRDSRPGNVCSWVLTFAQGAPGRERAPKNGTLARIRILACSGGSFVLQVARADPPNERARVIRSGPLINYRGFAANCNGGPLRIQTFAVNVPVRTNDYLAVVATRVGFIYSAGDDGLQFDPPLPDGGPLRTASNVDGAGILMLEAEYTN